ncbi:MAG: hypothetical protein RI932_742 [Pseudomonadota bacterium]|jgi:hypothetical protein
MQQTTIPRFFQELAPQWARLGLWQKKFTPVFERLRNATVQKISASDDGFLVLNIYKPGAARDPVLLSIQRTGSGIALGTARPQAQPKPNSVVQMARKYLQGRKVQQILLSLEPVAVIIEFAPPGENFEESHDWPADAPNCLVLDLDHRPARVCVAHKHSGVPERYASQCSGFEGHEDFFESHCEWSLENTKTKRRATFTQPLIFSCLRAISSESAESSATETAEAQPIRAATAVENVAVTPPMAALTTALPAPMTQGIAPTTAQTAPEITLQGALNLLPTHVRRAARTRIQFLERRLQRQKADLPAPHELNALRARAEGLRAHIYMWPKGFSQWHVPPDIISTAGLPPIITLKPGQSPGDLVSATFDELEKLKRRRDELERRVEESRIALERFEESVVRAGEDIRALPDETRNAQLSLAREVAHLVAVQRLLTVLEVTWTAGQQKSAALEAERERRLPYRSYRASTGEFMRVSKSAADADAMLKLMPSHHTWVHVVTGEGSHVWLEKPKGAKPSDTALREAAMLAIHHSKQTRAQEADVYVALRGDLDKRKDLSPGKVIVRRSEHRFVRYSQMELQLFMEKQE